MKNIHPLIYLICALVMLPLGAGIASIPNLVTEMVGAAINIFGWFTLVMVPITTIIRIANWDAKRKKGDNQ